MPTRLALWSLVVNIVVALALYKPLGIGGIVIGTTVSNGVMMVLLATRLRRRLGGLEIARTLRATGVPQDTEEDAAVRPDAHQGATIRCHDRRGHRTHS